MSNAEAPRVFILPAETIASAKALADQRAAESYAKWQEDTKDTGGVYRVGINLDKQFEVAKPSPKVTKIRAGLYSVAAGERTLHVEEIYDGRHWTWRVSDPGVFHDGWLGDFDTRREALAMISGLGE
jgi:hypothetical protein